MENYKKTISKSKIKFNLLKYLRKVESEHVIITITDRGRPVAQLIPYQKKEDPMKWLKGSVLKYEDPFEPVGLEDWEMLP